MEIEIAGSQRSVSFKIIFFSVNTDFSPELINDVKLEIWETKDQLNQCSFLFLHQTLLSVISKRMQCFGVDIFASAFKFAEIVRLCHTLKCMQLFAVLCVRISFTGCMETDC